MTDYRLAAGPADYAKAHALMQEEGMEEHRLSFPTVMAWKDGELTGVLSTTYDQNNVTLAGPLVLKSGARRSWTLIRLIDVYDSVMRKSGVKSYIFGVEKKNADWLEKIGQTVGLKPYAEKDGHWFYERKL